MAPVAMVFLASTGCAPRSSGSKSCNEGAFRSLMACCRATAHLWREEGSRKEIRRPYKKQCREKDQQARSMYFDKNKSKRTSHIYDIYFSWYKLSHFEVSEWKSRPHMRTCVTCKGSGYIFHIQHANIFTELAPWRRRFAALS